MSITIIDVPTDGASIQDDLWHIVASDNSGQTNFKYVFDVYDWAGRQLIRSKIYPDVNNGQGYFNVGNVVKNLITYDWFTPINASTPAFLNIPDISGQIGAKYVVKYGEDYNVGASGTTTLNMASGQTLAYNWTPPLWDRQEVPYIVRPEYRFLTNRPKKAKVCKDKLTSEKLLVPFQYNGGTYIQFEVKTFNTNNVNVAVAYMVVDTTIVDYDNAVFIQMDIAPNAVNQQLVIDNGAGFNIINANTAYYTIESVSYVTAPDKFRVDFECCNQYTPINLYFMNQYGLFDTAKFNRVNKLNMGVTRTSYTKKGLNFLSNEVSYFDTIGSSNVYNETKINYDQNASWKYKLMMDAPTDDEYKWLAELVTSPQVYMERDNNFYPVTITNTNYDYIERAYNGLKNLEIDIEVNQNRKGFKR